MLTTPRFQIVTRMPRQMRDLGFVAYVEDAQHPDGGPCSMSWHLSLQDAYRTVKALNRAHAHAHGEKCDA